MGGAGIRAGRGRKGLFATWRVAIIRAIRLALAALSWWWLPWAAADSSHRLYPEGWSHTDRATYAVWWGWSGWCGDVAAPVDTDGLAARAGLRPSTLRRRSHPAGLWNHRGDRLAVGRWEDPSLDAHREQVRYDDYRCSVPGRSGLEGATVRWHGHTSLPEADTAPPSVNEPLDGRSAMGWSHRLQALLYNLRA